MFRKVHFRLAALCAGITGAILLVMSFGYLYISEQGLKSNSFTAFTNDMDSLMSELGQQTVITHEWLTRMENNGNYSIYIIDNGIPFLFNERNSEEEKQLFRAAWDYYNSHYEVEVLFPTYDSYISHIEFSFPSSGKGADDYYACAASSERNGGAFQVMVLSSMAALRRQIQNQRLLFFALDAAAFLALSLFGWYFTKWLLKPLEENQRRQAQFVASASHELRTPLAAILSCASALEKADASQRKHFLDAIQSEGMRMSKLLGDMLLLTNADSHNWTICREPAELDTLLLDVCETFESMAAEKSIRLSVHLPDESVPALSCDKERIRQVLAILVHNAISYTPAGGRIRLSLAAGSKNIRISVADNGIGIPDSEKPHIFERFYRAEQSRSRKEHFGLGLCIAMEIIQAHRGQLFVEDTPGGGSTFVIVLGIS